jgi:NAD(P)-dependent dehydrogenase (short-subunit alcohol dehydrogenase family)
VAPVVIVTGASRGLGAAAALAAAEEGANVVLTARTIEDLQRQADLEPIRKVPSQARYEHRLA